MEERSPDGGTGSPGVIIRSAAQDDIPRIIELFEHGSLRAGKEDPTDLAGYRAALADIAQGAGDVLVATVRGEVVGVCQLIVFRHLQAKGGLCAEVESVHVHPDWRRHGVGRALMGAARQRAYESGCYRLQLTSDVARPGAHRFYEALGYTPSHRGFKLLLGEAPSTEAPSTEAQPEGVANHPPSRHSG